MKSLTVTTQVQRPLEEVFAAFTDFETMPKVLHSARTVEFVSPTRTGLGCEWIQTSDDPEDPIRATHKVVAFESPSMFQMTSDDGSALETMTFRFTDAGPSTQVSFTLEMRPKGLLPNLLSRFFRSTIQQNMTDDLQRMKQHIDGSV